MRCIGIFSEVGFWPEDTDVEAWVRTGDFEDTVDAMLSWDDNASVVFVLTEQQARQVLRELKQELGEDEIE